ncbi:MAG TPA: leucine-rich repeat domain-containing protein, partial [Clostridia bacterium]|nr:leucine-rich repeat domain-containing protein [Clostridia bacterium]
GNNLQSISNYAFTNCNSLENVDLGKVRSIGEYAFSGITTIEDIDIPSTVTFIGKCAFQNMTNASFSFSQGNNVIIVGDRAFVNCLKLTDFNALNLQNIGKNVFSGCRALTRISLVSNTTLYSLFGTTSFDNSYEIVADEVSYYVPASLVNVTVIANAGGENIVRGVLIENALLDAYHVKSVVLIGSFTNIEKNAFFLSDTNKITAPIFSLSMSDVNKIDSYAFVGRKDLTSITLPSSVYEIGEYAFYELHKLSSVSIALGNGLNKIGKYAFQGTKWLEEYNGVAKLGKIAIGFGTNYISTGGRTSLIPSDLIGVTIIAPNAFVGNIGLLEVTIPSTITTISTEAFADCVNLQKIEIPIECINIGDDIFSGCYNLSWVKLGLSVDLHRLFGQSPFDATYVVTKTEEYYIPSTLAVLNLLADSETIVAKDRYNGYSSLTSIILGDGITKIQDLAFADCTLLTTLTIPSSLTEIGVKENEEDTYEGAFKNCSELKYLNIPIASTLTKIFPYAFSNTKITSVQIPSMVTTIGAYAFANTALKNLTFIAGTNPLTIEEFAFYGINTDSTGFSLLFPTNLVSIGTKAFYGNTNLSQVTLNAQLTSIGAYAFANCNIERFSIPSQVELYDEENNCLVYGLLQNNNNLNKLTLSNGIKVEDLFIDNYPVNLTEVIVNGGKILDNQFQNLTSLQIITLTDITHIGKYAFDGCNHPNLVSITVPSSVINIDDNAFSNCTGLTNFLIFSNSQLETVGKNIFAGDVRLKQVLFPDSIINTDWDGIFDGCISLTTTNIPQTVTTIGNNTFNNCNVLKSINIPDKIVSIGDSAFNNCVVTAFENCNFEYLTTLGANAFANCEEMISFKAENIETIGSNAFSGCINMNEITIIDATPSFYISNLTKLTTVNVSSYASTLESGAFDLCDSLVMILFATSDSVKLDQMLTVLNDDNNLGHLASSVGIFISRDMYLALEENINSYSVDIYSYPTIFESEDYDFDQETMTATIISSTNARGVLYIPKHVQEDGNEYTVTSIGKGAFKNNADITSVIISSSIVTIAEDAFYNCTNLKDVTFEAGSNIVSIGDFAFEQCVLLGAFDIPDSVVEIGIGAFYECNSLSTIKLSPNNNLATIKEYAFTNTSWLDNYQGLATLGKIAIAYGSIYITNKNVTTITATDLAGVVKIAPYAFAGISTLTSVTVPQNVTSIGDSAFRGCSGLTSITLPFVGESVNSTNSHFGYIFGAGSYENNSSYVPSSLESVIITGGTNIGSYAFYDCSGLTSITIPNSVTSLGSYAFSGCSGLTSITIPNSVTSIEELAFTHCISLANIYILSDDLSYVSLMLDSLNADPNLNIDCFIYLQKSVYEDLEEKIATLSILVKTI